MRRRNGLDVNSPDHLPEPNAARYDMNLRGMPRALMNRALVKCRRQIPPVALKWKIVELLTAWVESARSDGS